MWILESTGDFFQGRRMWLKPGKQYLFGRAKKDGVRFAIDHKTVSRKHFVITVDEVQDIEVGNVYARTKVTIADQGSKSGTSVNGEKAKEPRTLTKPENVIKLGTCAEELIIKWEPKVLTWNLLKKEIKAGVLKTKQERVRDLDLKAISDYIPGVTTHFIASKRNTAKGLQCLIDAKFLVAESYIDALEYAATPADLNEEENLSPLEQDFEKAWPSPADYLPASGKEPTVRPSESYQPDSRRENVFEKFTFIFGDRTQFDNLLPPITTGHGKALLFTLVEGETTADDLIKYMRNAAGSKGFGDAQRDIDQGAVILVRWTSKDNPNWTNDLINQVALKLDQRAIEQGEFLDAILANDASLLRQAVPFESNGEERVAPETTGALDAAVPSQRSQHRAQIQADPASQITNDGRGQQVRPLKANGRMDSGQSQTGTSATTESRPINKSFILGPRKKNRLRNFDDGFDEDAVVPYEDGGDNISVSEGIELDQRRLSSVTTDPPHGDSDQELVKTTTRASRKRPYTSVEEQDVTNGDENDEIDALLPAAAAMKRLKTAKDHASRTSQTPAQTSRLSGVLPALRARTLKEVDVKGELRAKREATRRLEEDEEDRPIEFDEKGKLPVFDVQTDYVDIPLRKKPAYESNGDGDGDDNPRWDPKWNGRKNFKAFRRARKLDDIAEPRRRTHTRVIVPLVDARPTTYGIGDRYWDKTAEEKERRKKASQRTSQSQQSSNRTDHRQIHDFNASDEDAMDEPDHTHRSASVDRTAEDAEDLPPSSVSRLQQEAAEIADHAIDVDEPRQTRTGHRATNKRPRSSGDNSTQGRVATQTSTSSTTRGGTKRPNAPSSSSAATAAARFNKRQKMIPVQTIHASDSESEDSDDMKFKFGRGRRAAKAKE